MSDSGIGVARRISVIFGAAGGIGAAIASRLGARGDRLVLVDIDGTGVRRCASRLISAGMDVSAYEADVTDPIRVASVCEAVGGSRTDESGKVVDYVGYCAGSVKRGRVTELSLADWDSVIESQLIGAAHVCRIFGPRVRRGGAMLMSASDYSVVGMSGGACYAAAKAGVYALVKCAALEFAEAGVRINAVGAGPVDTDFLRIGRTDREYTEFVSRVTRGVPMARLGEPSEVAAVAGFLLSDESAYVTGQLIQPNGGQVMW